MRIGAMHTYFGGFLHGLMRADAEVLVDYEAWPLGYDGALASGLPVRAFEKSLVDDIKLDMVVANPPCSRFSHFTKSSAFNECHRTRIDGFTELLNVIEFTERSGARAMWWETGPLFWNQGRKMMIEIKTRLSKTWKSPKVLVVKYNTTHSGIPQNRPRCHVLCLDMDQVPRHVAMPSWLPEAGLGDWVERRVNGYELKLPCLKRDAQLQLERESVREYVQFQRLVGKFKSSMPVLLNENQRVSPAIVSRPAAWDISNRWLDLLELATLMDYPLDVVSKAFETLECARRPSVGIALLSKSVCPAATETIYKHVVIPSITNTQGIPCVEYAEDCFELVLQGRSV